MSFSYHDSKPNRFKSHQDFLNAMQEYIHLEKDLNTSYSLSSHMIRKLKLVRKCTFELQHLLQQQQQQQQQQNENHVLDNTNPSSDSNHLHGFFMKGLEPTLMLERKEELLLLQVCETILEYLMNGIMEHEYEQDIPVAGLNHTTNFHYDDNDEGIVIYLEFLHLVYSIMEVDILYDISQLSISPVSCTERTEAPWTLVRLLLHLLVPQPHLNTNNNMDHNVMMTDHDGLVLSKQQEFKWDKKKYLSLCILSKVLLTAEFVQRFCTSCTSTSLPLEATESSLGVDMGIGLIQDHKTSMTSLMKLVMKDIASKIHMETTETNISMVSLVFLCVLYRTNPKEWFMDSIPFMDPMMEQLHSIVLTGVHEYDSILQKFIHSMATSTLLLIQYHNGSNTNQTWIKSDDIYQRFHSLYSKDTRSNVKKMEQYILAQYIIHLSMCRNENTAKEMRSSDFQRIINDISSDFGTVLYDEKLSIHFMIWTYWLTYHRFYFRSLLGEAWSNPNIIRNIHAIMIHNKTHASMLAVFLRMLLSGPSRSRDTIGTWIWGVFLMNEDCQTQLQNLFNMYLIPSDICQPSHLGVLQLFQDLIQNDTLCKLVWKCMESDSIKSFIQILNVTSHVALQCQASLSVAFVLGTLACNHEDSLDNLTIRQAITRFASNSHDENIHSHAQTFDHQGIFQYAITQSQSCDMTRRAVMLQSIIMRIQDGDCEDFANAIFYLSLDCKRITLQASEQASQYKKEKESLSTKCEELIRENRRLTEVKKVKEISFHRELSKCRRQAQVDVMEMTDAHVNEQKKLKETCSDLKEKLSDAHSSLNQLKDELTVHHESKVQLEKDVDTLKSEIMESEKTLKLGRIAHDKLQRQYDEKSMEIDQAYKEIQELTSDLKDTKRNEQELVDVQNDLKNRLEESLTHLISIAEIYSSKNQEYENDSTIIKRKLQAAELELDKANSHSRDVEEKYVVLKQKYQEVKNRLEKAKQNHVQENSRISESRTHKSTRKPMGTLAFMNSIHDTSFRLEKAKYNNEHDISTSNHNRPSSRSNKAHDYDSSRKSKFRIVK